MSEIIIHAGMPKTGSTAIQEFLFLNQEKLLSKGVLFPITGRYDSSSFVHHALFYALCPDREKIGTPLAEPEYLFDEYCTQLQIEISKHSPRSVILSSEMLFNPVFDMRHLLYFKERMSFCNIRVLVVLRRQEDHIESSYAQRVTGPQEFSGSPSQHLDEMRASGSYDYYERLKTFEAVFGRENILVFWYHDVKLDASQIIMNLCQINESSLLIKNNRINVKRNWLYVKGMYYVNKYTNRNTKFRVLGCKLVYVTDRAVSEFGLRRFANWLCRPYAEEQKKSLQAEFLTVNHRVNERYLSRQ